MTTRDEIVPDTKDWTWVLERRCPECAFEAGAVAGSALPALLRSYATRWQEVLLRPDVARRPSGVWSPLEYACHVRDASRVFRARAELMLAEDDPAFESWDQDATALVERYDEQVAAAVADELRDAVEGIAATFAGVVGEQWTRTGRRSDGSVFTVETLGRYFAHDMAHHLWDVRSRAEPSPSGRTTRSAQWRRASCTSFLHRGVRQGASSAHALWTEL